MQSKISIKLILLTIGFVGVIFFIIINFFPMANISNPVSYTEPIPISPVISQALQNLINAQSQGSTTQIQPNAQLPIRLMIPKISVDAAVEYVGLTSDGAMDIPKGPDNVGWFIYGPRPGGNGSSVMAGHYGWKNNIPAVFDNLSKLNKGDKIYVKDDMGTTTTFIVREIGMYTQNEDASKVFSSNDGKAHLNLVTCEGIWSASQKSYANRLVVFTDKE